MAVLMSSPLHQLHSRLAVPSAMRSTDFGARTPQDSVLRSPTSAMSSRSPRLQVDHGAFSRRCPNIECGYCSAASSTAEPAIPYSTTTLKPTTLYDVLEISDMVTDDEVKAAFRRIAKEVHPDQAPPDQVVAYQEKFKEVHKAYSVLKDPRTRSLYNFEMRNSVFSRQMKIEDWQRPLRHGSNWETDQCWTS